jgi:hypothetical protein
MGWFSDIWETVRSSWQDPVDQALQERILPLEVDSLQTRFLAIDKNQLPDRRPCTIKSTSCLRQGRPPRI